MIIGLTGGIASGKSTVSNYLRELGAFIIDSDQVAHNIIEKDKPAYQKIVKRFGSSILDKNREINRSRLARIIFDDYEKKRKLEEITHPYILDEIYKKMEEMKDKYRIIILDAPLLFETGLDRAVDQTWVVYVNREIQLERLIKRDQLSSQEGVKRIEAQLSLEKKKEMADFIIDNNGSIKQLRLMVQKKWRAVNED